MYNPSCPADGHKNDENQDEDKGVDCYGEEHDAKLLFGGEVTGDYWIDVETGEVEDLNAEESE